MKNKKLPSLPFFTDTFTAETVHLSNKSIGIYIRLLSFAWTKNAKPFTTESAYTICQCINEKCKADVDSVLIEFFQLSKNAQSSPQWTHKRLTQEHDYLINYYEQKSISGKKGSVARSNFANNKNEAHIPIPISNSIPINKFNNYDLSFLTLWKSLIIKKGSKYKAHQLFLSLKKNMPPIAEIIKIYNQQQCNIDDKFVPHFATWLQQRRWEIEENDQKHAENTINIINKMEKLGYNFRYTESNFDYFKKDGKDYKIDKYDKNHIIHNIYENNT